MAKRQNSLASRKWHKNVIKTKFTYFKNHKKISLFTQFFFRFSMFLLSSIIKNGTKMAQRQNSLASKIKEKLV